MERRIETFREIFLKGDFVEIYFEKFVPIITDSLSNSIERGMYDEFLNRNDKEIKVKKFSSLFVQFVTILSDLEKTIIFLKIESHHTINDIYPELENTEYYYTYLLENYLIRITTIADVLGKILDLIYNTNIKKPNIYLFTNKIKGKYPALLEELNKLSNKISVLKEKRHEKLHEGITELEYLKNIVFWNELHKLMKKEVPESLKRQTQSDIDEMIETIKNEIIEIIYICKNIMNMSSSKMTNYLEE